MRIRGTICSVWPRAGGPVRELPSLDHQAEDYSPVVSSDGLTIYFESLRADGGGMNSNIWQAHRTDVTQEFGAPQPVDGVNTADFEYPEVISNDGCRLYFARRSSSGPPHLYLATRQPLP